jgi:hypothetical protein
MLVLTGLEAWIGKYIVNAGLVAENKSMFRALWMSLHLVNTFFLLTENSFNLTTEGGQQLVSSLISLTDGADPQVMLRWSDDGGHTWSNEHWARMGRAGEYGKRVIWRRLGMTTKLRDRVYEISGSDPVKIAIMGAELSATPTSA